MADIVIGTLVVLGLGCLLPPRGLRGGAMRLCLISVSAVLASCYHEAKPTTLNAETNRSAPEVISCVMARASADGYVPSGGGASEGFLELSRGKENLGATIITGTDMSYNEGLTVIASGDGAMRLSIYRTNANATKNAVRYAATEDQMAYATVLWNACTAARKECMPIQDDYDACMAAGGVDPTQVDQ